MASGFCSYGFEFVWDTASANQCGRNHPVLGGSVESVRLTARCWLWMWGRVIIDREPKWRIIGQSSLKWSFRRRCATDCAIWLVTAINGVILKWPEQALWHAIGGATTAWGSLPHFYSHSFHASYGVECLGSFLNGYQKFYSKCLSGLAPGVTPSGATNHLRTWARGCLVQYRR